jgi:DNA-binding beta-propeller fold protein YncE
MPAKERKVNRTVVFNLRMALKGALLILLALDGLLAFSLIKIHWFATLSLYKFMVMTWLSFSGIATALVSAFAALRQIAIVLNKNITPKSLSKGRLISLVALFRDQAQRLLGRLAFSLSGFLLLAALAPALAAWIRTDPPFQPPASAVMVISRASGPFARFLTGQDAQTKEQIWAADEQNGTLERFDPTTLKRIVPDIPMDQERAGPHRLIFNSHSNNIYALDTVSHSVIEMDQNGTVISRVTVGLSPHAMVITPDGQMLYVGNVQVAPQGSISVINLREQNTAPPGKIIGIGCPEGRALSRTGTRLYVASQCGCGNDPVFVINTTTDRIVASIPDLAVGGELAITPDNDRLYVTRGDRLSVVISPESQHPQIWTYALNVGMVAISPDGRYVLTSDGREIDIFFEHDLAVGKFNPVRCRPAYNQPATIIAGLAIASDDSAYAFFPYRGHPEQDKLFTTSCNGLGQATLLN